MSASLWIDPPATVALSISTEDLKAWLVEHGLNPAVDVLAGPDVPAGVITATLVHTEITGPGDFTEEGSIRSTAFQVRTIGPSRRPDVARDLALGVDALLTDTALFPTGMGGLYVHSCGLSGGTPGVDRIDTANRTQWVCTYLAAVSADTAAP